MTEQRTKYADSILTTKSPYEATETIRIRLSQVKLLNKDFYLLFKELANLKRNYAQQLRKIIAENEDITKILNAQMIESNVLTPQEMSAFRFNSLGELRNVWDTVIEEDYTGKKIKIFAVGADYDVYEDTKYFFRRNYL